MRIEIEYKSGSVITKSASEFVVFSQDNHDRYGAIWLIDIHEIRKINKGETTLIYRGD